MTLQEFTTQVKNSDYSPEDKAKAIKGFFISQVANTDEFASASDDVKNRVVKGFEIVMNEVSKPKSSILGQMWSGFRESATGKLLNKATVVPLRKEVPIEERSQPLEFVREQFDRPIPPPEGIPQTLAHAGGSIAGDLSMYTIGGAIPEIAAASKLGQLGARALHGVGAFAIPAIASTGGDIKAIAHSAGLGALLPIANLPAKWIFRALAGASMGAGYAGATGGNKDEMAANSILFGVMSALSPQMRFKVVEEVKANPDMPIGKLPSFREYGLEQELIKGIKRKITPEDVRGLEGAYHEKTLKPFERITPEVVEEPLPKQIEGMPERRLLPEPQTKRLSPSPITYGDNFVSMSPDIAPEPKYPYAGQKRLPPATDFEITPEGQGINIKGQEAISKIEPSQILFDNLTKPQAIYQQSKRFKETGIKPEIRQMADGAYYLYEMKPDFKLPIETEIPKPQTPPKPYHEPIPFEGEPIDTAIKPTKPFLSEDKIISYTDKGLPIYKTEIPEPQVGVRGEELPQQSKVFERQPVEVEPQALEGKVDVSQMPQTPMRRRKNIDALRKEMSPLSSYDIQSQVEWLGNKMSIPESGKLKIYRATPEGHEILEGDYVTTSKQYAEQHIQNNLRGKGKITEKVVSLDEIYPADAPNEFWYVKKEGKVDVSQMPYIEVGNKVKGSNQYVLKVMSPEGKEIGKTIGDNSPQGHAEALSGYSDLKSPPPSTEAVKGIPEKASPLKPKEAWEMTRKEYLLEYGNSYDSIAQAINEGRAKRTDFSVANKELDKAIIKMKQINPDAIGDYGAAEITHRRSVEKALSEGKPVPAEVLKEYPDLKPTVKEPLTFEQGKIDLTETGESILKSEQGGASTELLDTKISKVSKPTKSIITVTEQSSTGKPLQLKSNYNPRTKSWDGKADWNMTRDTWDVVIGKEPYKHVKTEIEARKLLGESILKSEQGGASLDLLVPESLEHLANFTSKKITDAIPHLENIGKSVYRVGMKLNEFVGRMKDSLGDLWDKFKGFTLRIWMNVKKWNEGLGERGSVRIWDEKSETWTETSGKTKTQDMRFDEINIEPSPEITPKEYSFKGRPRGVWRDTLKNFIGITSTELGGIHSDIKVAARKNVLGRMRQIYLDEVEAKPFLDANKKLSFDEQMRLKEAALSGRENTARGIIGNSLDNAKNLFEKIRQRAIKAGYDIQEFTGFYFPRVVGDAKGLLNALRQDKYKKEWSAIDDAIREIEAKKGGLTDAEKSIVADQMLRGYPKERITLSEPYTDPAHMKSRKLKEIPPELLKYYLDLPEALTSYIKSMNHAIKTAEFFGKGKNNINPELITDMDIQKSIGDYVIKLKKEGKLKAEDEFKLRDHLQAVFKPTHANYGVQAFKNLTYLQVLGQFSPALTQIIDLALVSEKIGYRETFKAYGKALIGKSEIKTKDIGVDKILYEFSQGGEDYIAKVLDKTLKLTGFSAIDRLGKETLLNGKLSVMRKQARERNPKLIKELKDLDLPVEETINDLIAGKKSENILFILANTLSDIQPISELEVPKAYLKAKYGKVFYMLKTYQLKLLDVYRNEVYEKVRSGTREEKIEGIKKLVTLSTSLFLLGASTDQLKDFMLLRETDFNDMMWDNIFKLGGVSKYTMWQARQMGLSKAVVTIISPPAGILETGLKDLQSLIWEGNYGKDLLSTKYIPIGGGLYYWWLGAGEEKMREKERKGK